MKSWSIVFSVLVLISSVWMSFALLMPEYNAGQKVSPTAFSTDRALAQLREISRHPHYVGSPDHTRVRDNISDQLREMGLEVETQEQLAVNQKWRGSAVTINLISKIKGSGNGKKLLIMTHYDSAPHSSPGASDAGSGVVTILEALRAFITSKEIPKNDIIILFSDAEELGLLGAKAFVNHHPWAKDIGLVLNFEARGSGGPSIMLLETNGGNAALIEAFGRAKPPYAVGNSLLYSLYKMLPNDTDLTVFREDDNIDGFNFAFIDDHFDYHTALDTYDRLDRNTLEHQGSYLTSLMKYFSNAELSNLKSDKDHVFFSMAVFGFIYYPFSWVFPMLIVMTISLICLIYLGLIRGVLTFKGIFMSFLPFLVAFLISILLTVFGWMGILKVYPAYTDILHGFTYNGYTYILAFSSFTIGICLFCYDLFYQKFSSANWLTAPLLFWTLINLGFAIYLPGGGFFILPLIAGLMALGFLIYYRGPEKVKPVILSLFLFPLLLLFSPLIKLFPVGLGLITLPLSTALIVLLFGIAAPLFYFYPYKKYLATLFIVLGFISLVMASLHSGYSVNNRAPNSLNYVQDADINEAFWITFDRSLDEYTGQVFGDHPVKGAIDEHSSVSKYGSRTRWHLRTEVKPILPPIIKAIRKDSMSDDLEFYELTIIPQRAVNRIDLMAENAILFNSFAVNGESLERGERGDFILSTDDNHHILSYFVTPGNEHLTIEFSTSKDANPIININEAAFDLSTNPLFNLDPRSPHMMPKPFVVNDATIIKKKVEF